MGLLRNFYLKKSGQNRLDLKLRKVNIKQKISQTENHGALQWGVWAQFSISQATVVISNPAPVEEENIWTFWINISPVISQKIFIEVQYTLNYYTLMSCCSSSHYPSSICCSLPSTPRIPRPMMPRSGMPRPLMPRQRMPRPRMPRQRTHTRYSPTSPSTGRSARYAHILLAPAEGFSLRP